MADLKCGVEGNGSLRAVSFIDKALNSIDGVLFPAHCLVCGEFGVWVCSHCEKAIRWMSGSREAPSLPSGKRPAITRYWSLASYADRSIQGVIQALKYRGATCVVAIFERWISFFAQRHGETLPWLRGEAWTLVPVPTAPSHIRERGLDHALVLAEAMQRVVPTLNLATHLVARAEETGFANAELDDDQLREANVMRQWILKTHAPERILLLDDVYTTGSTVQSLARVLLAHGAKEIEILTIATGR